MKEKKFYSKHTQYDPEYRNVQSELWQLLTNEQQAIIGSVFAHLKNHAQIEIAENLIDFIEADILPKQESWDNPISGGAFHFIIVKAFPEKVDAFIEETVKNDKTGRLSKFIKGFRKSTDSLISSLTTNPSNL